MSLESSLWLPCLFCQLNNGQGRPSRLDVTTSPNNAIKSSPDSLTLASSQRVILRGPKAPPFAPHQHIHYNHQQLLLPQPQPRFNHNLNHNNHVRYNHNFSNRCPGSWFRPGSGVTCGAPGAGGTPGYCPEASYPSLHRAHQPEAAHSHCNTRCNHNKHHTNKQYHPTCTLTHSTRHLCS